MEGKKSAHNNPNNYCAVHLTPVISKAAERLPANFLVPYFGSSNSIGSHQWAYRKGKGAKDLLAALVASFVSFLFSRVVSFLFSCPRVSFLLGFAVFALVIACLTPPWVMVGLAPTSRTRHADRGPWGLIGTD